MSVLKQRNSLVVVLIAVAVGVLSVILILIGTADRQWWNVLLLQLGLALLIAALFSGLWEWHGKRILAQEIYELAGVGANVQRWGIRAASMDWRTLRWSDLIEGSSNIDVLFSWARTWRGHNFPTLEAFSTHPGKRLRVCLPDPDQDWLMVSLSNRYGTTPGEVRAEIQAAAKFFIDLRRPGGAAISVFYRRGEPLYSMHRFDSKAVIVLYPHQQARGKSPTLLVGGGDLFSFAREDFESALETATEISTV